MDDIQRKLALIDAQRNARVSNAAVLVRTAPLFLPAIALMIGIVLQGLLTQWQIGSESPALLWIWTILLGLSAATACVGLAAVAKASCSHGKDGTCATDHSLWLAFSASICFLCLGAIRLLAFETAPWNDIRHLVGEQRRLATIRGRILTEPCQERQDWCFAPFANADPSCSFYLNVEWIKTLVGWSQIAGTVRVHVDELTPDLGLGDSIQAYCWLHRFEPPANPGQFDLAAYLKRRNVHVGASVPSRDAIERQDRKSTDILTTLRRRFAEAAAQGLLEHAPADTQSEALLEALLLGERRDIDRDTYEAFRKTGLLHLISLSGMHLGIFVGMVWWLCRLAGMMKPARAVVCIGATVAFLLVVPPRAPTLRAAVIVWAFCFSILFRRRANPLNSLSLAAIVVLLVRPTQLFEAGWQLSFSAVAGILAFTGRIEHFLHDHTGDWFRQAVGAGFKPAPTAGPAIRWARGLGYQAIRAFSAGTAAWLGSAGILLYHFYTITPLASLWTVLVFVPVAAILMLGFLKIILFFLLPTVSMVLGLITSALADSLIRVVKLIAQIDVSSTLIGHVPLALILLFYALVLSARFTHPRRPGLKKGLCTVLAVILLGSLGLIKWHRTHRDHLSLTCLDVGHGQAILAQLPGTMNVLFDAGSLGTSDVGTRIVVPYCDYIGVSRLHAIVLSHGDIDHINGVPEVVDRRRTDRVHVHDAFLAQAPSAPTAGLLLRHLESKGVEVGRPAGTMTAGPTRIHILWPAGESAQWHGLSDNDTSLVCLIEFAGIRVLLCSDIERFAQGQIVGLYPELKADVVVVPHHGSARTLDERFLPHLGARVPICSCGRQDVERGRVIVGSRQAPDRKPQAELYLTARDGAVTVCIDRQGVVEASSHIVHTLNEGNLNGP